MQLRIKLCRVRNYLGARDNCVCSIVGASGAAVAWKLSDERRSLLSTRDDGEIFNYMVDNIESFRNYDIELITPAGFL